MRGVRRGLRRDLRGGHPSNGDLLYDEVPNRESAGQFQVALLDVDRIAYGTTGSQSIYEVAELHSTATSRHLDSLRR